LVTLTSFLSQQATYFTQDLGTDGFVVLVATSHSVDFISRHYHQGFPTRANIAFTDVLREVGTID
jgi:hypothetical protein